MPFFDNLSKKVSDAAKTAAKKSGDLVEVTKLNRAISTEEEKARGIYLDIGKTVFTMFQNGQISDDNLMAFCRQIAEINNNIELIKEKILDIKDLNICPTCKHEVEQGTLFCPKCGAKIEEHDQEPVQEQTPVMGNAEQAPQAEEQKPAEKFCPSCGNKYVEGTLFCSSCGNKLR
jgi:NADH pyrophosphatase NudC (nudix superfamily)